MTETRPSAEEVGAAKAPEPEQPAERVSERIRTAVETLLVDTRDDAALGDAASQTRNIAVSDAAWVLCTLIESKREHASKIVDRGGVEALILALRRRPNSEAVQSKATCTLSLLTECNPPSRTGAVEAGGIEVLISAMRGFPASEVVQQNAIQALAHLLEQDVDSRERARLAGGVEVTVVALEQHPVHRDLQASALRLLGLLVMENYEAQMQAGNAQGLVALARAVKEHHTCETVLEAAIEALGYLVADNTENQGVVRDNGALGDPVLAMQRFPESSRIQCKSMCTIRHLVKGNRRNQTLVGQTEAIVSIANVFKVHSTDEAVKMDACETFRFLVLNSQDNQQLAREAGLIEAVIHEVLANHPNHAGLQIKALLLLSALVADSSKNQQHAGEQGGFDVATAALRQHFENEVVIESAAETLGNLAACNPANQVLAGKAGALEALIDALKSYGENEQVRSKGLYALRTLILGNHTNTMIAVSAGGVQDVICALQNCPRGAQEEDTENFSSEQRCQRLAKEAGLIEAVATTLKDSRRHPESKARLLNALADAVSGNYENQRVAGEAGAIDAVVSVMKGHLNVEKLQEAASRTLTQLIAECSHNQRAAKAVDADETLLYAKDVHFESPEVQMAIRGALEALCSGEVFHERIFFTEYGKRHQTCNSMADTATRGVTLEQILELHDFIQETLRKHDIVELAGSGGAEDKGASLFLEDMTMYQVRDHFIVPLTKDNQCSFVEVVAQGKQQPPMWMVSHWWGTPFNFTVRMLELQARSRHLHGAATVTYWCDAFANSPHGERVELDEGDVLKSPFARAMLSAGCMGTVLLCDPNVTPLLRTWCVFEAHITQQLRSGALADRTDKKRYFLDILATAQQRGDMDQVTITMLQDAVGGSWNEVSDTEGVYFPLDIAHVGVGIDFRQSEASLESDRASILNYLTEGVASKHPPAEAHPKYEEMNHVVHEVFASAELYRVASEQEEACVEEATALLKMRADVNSFVRKGNTPLFAAAGADPAAAIAINSPAQHALMKVLLAARAEVNHANTEMKTVLDCATALSKDSRELLLEHGAKTFADAAPELEKAANSRLSQIVSSGFGSERQAFIGGDAGTRLTQAALRCLQVAASSVLKLYHWAPCRIGVQTGNGRHQAQLADERADSVRLALQSAGCRNSFDFRFGVQKALLALTVSLAPPSSKGAAFGPPRSPIGSRDWERSALGAANLDLIAAGGNVGGLHPRSPHAVLGLRTAPNKLPPVAPRAPSPVRALSLGAPLPSSVQEGSPVGVGPRRLAPPRLGGPPGEGLKPCPVPVELDATALQGRHPLPQSSSSPAGTDGRPTTSQGPRQVGLPGMRHMPLSQMPQATASSRAARSRSQPQTPPGHSHSHPTAQRAAKDLETMAGGDRWFQTSITCSWSSPNLHSLAQQQGHGTSPQGGGSSRSMAKLPRNAAEADAPLGLGWSDASANAKGTGDVAGQQALVDGRPPTRNGGRRNGSRPAPQDVKAQEQFMDEAMRRHSLPSLTTAAPQRSMNATFTVSDLTKA